MRALLVAIVFLFPLVARAQTPEPVYATVERAQARVDGKNLIVTIEIEARSWRFLSSRGITPRAVIEVEGGRGLTRFEGLMKSAATTMTFNLGRGVWPQVARLTIDGQSQSASLAWLSLGGVELTMLPLRIAPPPPQAGGGYGQGQGGGYGHGHGGGHGHGHGGYGEPLPPPPSPAWSATPAVIQACTAVFDGAANENACLTAVTSFRFDPTNFIGTCDAIMDGDANELSCLQTAQVARVDPSPQLRACDSVMDGDANELSCLAATVQARYDMSPTIATCDSVMDGDANELACLAAAARARQEPSEIIRACDARESGDVDELRCLEISIR